MAKSNPPPASSFRFLAKVALVASAAFFAVFYSDRLATVGTAALRIANGHQRENSPPDGAYYYNCDDARSAGVAPLYAGEPGYRIEMDGDNDGVACEPYYY